MKKLLLYIILLLNTVAVLAEPLEGIVKSETGEPLQGVNIRISGSALGKVTNQKGEFRFEELKQGKYELLISSVGYETKIVPVDKLPANLNVILKEQAFQTSEIVVTASKRLQAVQEAPISISTIDERQLEIKNIQNLDEALNYTSGVEVAKDNVSIRGSSGFSFGVGSRVSLLMDGFPILAGDNGDMKHDIMPVFYTERIEVIKGAGSALYGASAIGGVVNIIIKDAPLESESKTRVSGGVFTQPRYQNWVYRTQERLSTTLNIGYSGRIKSLQYLISSGMSDDDSYRDYDDSKKYNFFSRLKYDAGNSDALTLTFSGATSDHADYVNWNSLDSATKVSPNTNRDARILSGKQLLFGEWKHIFNETHFLIVRSGAFLTNYKNNLDLSDSNYRQSDARSFNTEVQMSSRIFNNAFFLTYGLNYALNNVESKTYGDRNQHIFSGYAQAEFERIKNLNLTAGVRLDQERLDNSGEISFVQPSIQVSPKAGVSYRAPFIPNLAIRTSLGWGYRAPNIAERYSDLNFGGFEVLPNPGLLPEKSISYEAGASYNFKVSDIPVYLDAAGFVNEMSDLIEPTFNEFAKIMFKNITKARISGGEFNLKFMPLKGLVFETGYTYMYPFDETLKETLKYRSRTLWYNRLYYTYGGFDAELNYRYKSRVEEIDEKLIVIKNYDARVPVHIVDASISYGIQNKSLPLRLTLFAKNLLDYYYTEMVGNLAPTRFIGVQADLNF